MGFFGSKSVCTIPPPDSINVICGVKRTCNDKSTEFDITSKNNKHSIDHDRVDMMCYLQEVTPVNIDDVIISESSLDDTNSQQFPSNNKVPILSEPSLLFRPIPQPPSRSTHKSTATPVSSSCDLSSLQCVGRNPTVLPQRKRAYRKKKSLKAAASSCFAIDTCNTNSFSDDESFESNDISIDLSPFQHNEPKQFLLKMKDVITVELPYRSKQSINSKPQSSNNNDLHYFSSTLEIMTSTQSIELTFYNQQNRDIFSAFLKSAIPMTKFNTTTDPSLMSLKSLSLMDSDSESEVDMDNFEGMAVKERFLNEPFLDKMKRRCARLAIRTEEACFCCAHQSDSLKADATVNTSMMTNNDFEMLGDSVHYNDNDDNLDDREAFGVDAGNDGNDDDDALFHKENMIDQVMELEMESSMTLEALPSL